MASAPFQKNPSDPASTSSTGKGQVSSRAHFGCRLGRIHYRPCMLGAGMSRLHERHGEVMSSRPEPRERALVAGTWTSLARGGFAATASALQHARVSLGSHTWLTVYGVHVNPSAA